MTTGTTTGTTKSGAYAELSKIVQIYQTVLPKWTFPFVTLTAAACAVFFAWFGGNYLFHESTLWPRLFYSWMIALLEYVFLIIGIGGSVEVLHYSQNTISILIHAFQLIAYFVLNLFTTKVEFTWKQYLSMIFIFISIVLLVI